MAQGEEPVARRKLSTISHPLGLRATVVEAQAPYMPRSVMIRVSERMRDLDRATL